MSLPLKVIVPFFVALLLNGQLLADDYADGFAALKNKDFATAVRFFTQAITQNQNKAYALWGRGFAYDHLGEFDNAIGDYNEAIRLEPTNVLVLINRGSTWYAKGELDKALGDYEVVIRLDPNVSAAYAGRGGVWFAKHELDKAHADFNEAVRLDPTNSDAYFNRGTTWHANGEYEKALADFEEAIRLDSKSSEALNSRAWIRATCKDEKYRDGAKAVDDATKACELTDWRSPGFLDTLGAAFAESGQFDKAVETQKKAIDLAPESEKADFGTRLELYRAGKPYRQEPK